MRHRLSVLLVFLMGITTQAIGQTTYHGPTVETPGLRIELRPLGETRFGIDLSDKVSGRHRNREFEGEGANDPEPFLLVQARYCGTPVILLTIGFPWRHALPQHVRVLDTYPFRASDLAFIDRAIGPLTDVALLDSRHPEATDKDMQPPILVECLSKNAEQPFRFALNSMR